MDKKTKKPWVKPAVRMLEPTDELLSIMASHAKDQATSPAKRMK